MTAAVRPVAIVDYGMGNRRSVEKALAHLGAQVALSSDPTVLRDATALVLPGVGAFPLGMQNLRALGLDELIAERVAAGIPLIGICLGMQLLFDSSSEQGETRGLGLIRGTVEPLRTGGLRVPHIGWNEVTLHRASQLTDGFTEASVPFYHVHSLVARPEQPQDIIGTSEYGERFASIVSHANVYGVQFHPEKSSTDGLRLLRAFMELAGVGLRPATPATEVAP